MVSLSKVFKVGVAALFMKERERLEGLDPNTLESFAQELIKMIEREKSGIGDYHDLKVLEDSMKHLKKDAVTYGRSEPGTDNYDFSRNDCKNLINSMKKWLITEGLISQ